MGRASAVRVAAGAALAVWGAAAARADCVADPAPLAAAYDRAVAVRSVEGAIQAATAFSARCSDRAGEMQNRLAGFLIDMAEWPQTAPADRERALAKAEDTLRLNGSWSLMQRLADYHQNRGDRARAVPLYERAVAALGRPSSRATEAEKARLLQRLATARIIADDDREGARPVPPRQALRDELGQIGGVYAPALRGTVPVSVPLPINFFTNETRFTPQGERAVRELAEAIRQQDLPDVTIVGHADARGAPGHNCALSRRRAEAVRDALVREKIPARIAVAWRGATEPVNRADILGPLTQEEGWALDRRVVWIPNPSAPLRATGC